MREFDPKRTAVLIRFNNGFEKQVRIEPELQKHVDAVNDALDILGGHVIEVRPTRKRSDADQT